MTYKCTYEYMAESKLLCVRVATLLRNKHASILSVISQGFLFYCSRYLPSLSPGKENIDIALAITLRAEGIIQY